MTDSKDKSLKFRVIALLVIMTVTLYVAVELNLFISDQYVFYSAVTEQGLPYFTRKERQLYKNLSDADKHKLKLAQKKAATLEAASNAVRITLGLITTLLVGYLSDRYGRRLAFGILLLGELLHIGITSLIVLLKLNLWMVLLPGFLEAVLGGGLLSIFAQVAAILVDICQTSTVVDSEKKEDWNKKRSTDKHMWILFTVFDGIASLSISAGSPIGGALIYRYGFPVAVYTSLALLTPSIILIFCLPETYKSGEKRINVQDKQPKFNDDDLDEDAHSVSIQFKKTLKSRITEGYERIKSLDPILIMIMSLVLLGSVAALADLPYVAVYLIGPPFLWSPETIGLYSGVTDVTAAFISITCTMVIIKLDEKRQTKIHAEQNSTKQKSEKHYTHQMNLLVTVFAVSMVMLIINRSVVGIAYRFSLPTANLLIYVDILFLLHVIPDDVLLNSFQIKLIRCSSYSKTDEELLHPNYSNNVFYL
ncbi:adenylate cyclase [Schistosoma japonicum]|nr:adenylate cyclase [Schistosoma japonicum]